MPFLFNSKFEIRVRRNDSQTCAQVRVSGNTFLKRFYRWAVP